VCQTISLIIVFLSAVLDTRQCWNPVEEGQNFCPPFKRSNIKFPRADQFKLRVFGEHSPFVEIKPHMHMLRVYGVLLCFIKPILGNQ